MSDNPFIPIPLENPKSSAKNPLKMATVGDFRIRRFDRLNWVLEQLVPGGLHPITRQQAPDKWEFCGYYGQLADVAYHLLNLSIVLPDNVTGQQVLEAIIQTEKRITESLQVALE